MSCCCSGTDTSGPVPSESGSSYTSVAGSSLYKGGKKQKSKKSRKHNKKTGKKKTIAARKKMRKTRKNRKTLKKQKGGMSFFTGTVAYDPNGKTLVGHMVGAETKQYRGGSVASENGDVAFQPFGEKKVVI